MVMLFTVAFASSRKYFSIQVKCSGVQRRSKSRWIGESKNVGSKHSVLGYKFGSFSVICDTIT